MKQWRAMRETLPANVLLLFRLGDFYELFATDADDAAMIAGLGLTRRNGVSMCGFPVHAAPEYIQQLVKAGRKVAIAEQTEAPVPGKLTERQIREAGATEGVPAAADTPLARLREILSRRRKSARNVAACLTRDDLRALAHMDRRVLEQEVRNAKRTMKQALAIVNAISKREAREVNMERFIAWLHPLCDRLGTLWVKTIAREAREKFTGITRAKVLANIPAGFCLRRMDNGGGKKLELAVVRGQNLKVDKLEEKPLPLE